VYFKGAEKYTAEDVQKSERFEKQGQRILLAVHITVDTFDDEDTFKGYIRETINRHKIFKMDPNLWGVFFTVFKGFLESKGVVMSDKTLDAWDKFDKQFTKDCNDYLRANPKLAVGELKD
jgi:hypothetical protein